MLDSFLSSPYRTEFNTTPPNAPVVCPKPCCYRENSPCTVATGHE